MVYDASSSSQNLEKFQLLLGNGHFASKHLFHFRPFLGALQWLLSQRDR